jgi:hypothetical protein
MGLANSFKKPHNAIFFSIEGMLSVFKVVKWNLVSPSLIYTYKNIREGIFVGRH